MNLNAQTMLKAFTSLDKHLHKPVRLIVGGGGAMILAHQFILSTSDIDAMPAAGVSLEELDPLIKKVAKELSLPPDWLNPYFSTFAHVLPSDYGHRLIEICQLKFLKVEALSKEDLLVMKCCAGRLKDVVHARALVKKGADVSFVREHLQSLLKRRIPGLDKALDFLSEIEAFFENQNT